MKALDYLFIGMLFISMTGKTQPSYVPGQMLVQVNSSEELSVFLGQPVEVGGVSVDLEFDRVVSEPLGIYLLTFDTEATVEDQKLLKAVRRHPLIALAQFNHRLSIRCLEINDPEYPNQWHHSNDGQNGAVEDADIDSDLAWDITQGGTTATGDTIVICVIEGGNLNHVDLQANAWRNQGEIPGNGIDDDGNGYTDDYLGWNVDTQSDEGVLSGSHGTGVMGMIGARGGNHIGIVGANHRVKIMSVAGQDMYDEASIVAAYTYPLIMRKIYNESAGASGAFVVATNASWGLDYGNPEDVPLWSAVYDSLGTYGILNCVATSNSNINVDEVGDIPSTVTSEYVVAVTATNSADLRTFSAWGPMSIDLAAPGQNVLTTSGTMGYASATGTSFASPLAAGAIGLLYSVPCPGFSQFATDNPQAAADYVKQALLAGVDILPELIGKTVTGGRLNVFNSLVILMENCSEVMCMNPVGLTHSLSADTIHTLSWINLGDTAVDIRFKAFSDANWTQVLDYEGNHLSLDSLRRCTSYSFEMRSSCEGITTFSTCLTFETKGCCVAPDEFELSQVSSNQFTLAWPKHFGVDEYEILYRPHDTTEWLTWGSTADTAISIFGLEPCTKYDVFIHPTCDDNPSFGLNAIVTTYGCGACLDNEYCPAVGSNSDFEYIAEIIIGDVSIPSGNNQGYALFDDTDIHLIPGDTVPILLTPGFTFGDYEEYFSLWLDINQDGVFSEDEMLFASENPSSDPVFGQIIIPSTTPLGVTRMRVSMKFTGGSPGDPSVGPCEEFQYGETEDYCVTISDDTGLNDAPQSARIALYPNPTSGLVHLEFADWNRRIGELTIEIFDLSGRLVWMRSIQDRTFEITGLEPGIYTFRILSNKTLFSTGKILLTPGMKK